MPASRFADQRNTLRIHTILLRMFLHESHRGFHVIDRNTKAYRIGLQPVVDRKPRNPRVLQGLEERSHIGPPIAANPAAAVHDDRGRERSGAIRNRRVEPKINAPGVGKLHVPYTFPQQQPS